MPFFAPFSIVAVTGLLFGCGSRNEPIKSDTGTQPIECATEFSTVRGTVRSQVEWFKFGEVMPFATLLAIPKHRPGGPIALLADEHGEFEANLPEDGYTLMAQASGCDSELIEFTAVACTTVRQNIDIVECLDGAIGR